MQQPHPPLVLGGTVKRRFAALAARYATEVNTLGAPNDELRARKAALDRACAEAGRDPETLGYSVMTSCFVGESARDVLERVARFLAARGDDTDPKAVIAERRDRWLVGTVDEVAARLEELRELGVTRVFLQHLNHDDDAMIGLMAAPQVASRPMTTTEITGAEDVAWDLSDLYDGGDDPRIEQDVEETDKAAAEFRERYYGRSRS